ncbi:peptidase S26 [Ignicoccus islandicus DSM 13165]|uniref:Peptidase S26 n=1 Tax=Ignicoccus islandicus DSM 13165 TaxID=940295 RepID=A0A0U3E1W3_9CREN|nr:rhomboid family intramembrane serine protease [Ignicoccus islandicus]ALU11915.1 peptidase S26 [Ignicoccus islandicus DSM 13165]
MIPVGDINPIRKKPLVNTIIIALNVLVFAVLELPLILANDALGLNRLIKSYGMVPYFVVKGSHLYTLFTHMWLHASIDHIVGNMLFLAIFGDNVESILGRWKYFLLYIVSGLVAVAFHLASIALFPNSTLNPYLSQNPWLTPAVGASGAISGVLAAYFLFYPRALVKVIAFVPFPFLFLVPAEYFLGFWFLYQLIEGTWSLFGVPSGVAWWAHVGGFVAGISLAYFLVDPKEVEIHRRLARYSIIMGRAF